MGWTAYKLWGYDSALLHWRNALKEHLNPTQTFHHEGIGTINFSKGKLNYSFGKRQRKPIQYWVKAVENYETALSFLQFELFPEKCLGVLQELGKTYRSLGQDKKAQEVFRKADDYLRSIQSNPNIKDSEKLRLFRKFAGIEQLRVDELSSSHEPQLHKEAVLLAEERKNICLDWIRDGWKEKAELQFSFDLLDKLISPQDAVIYWHVSPVSITTFIIFSEGIVRVVPPKAKSISMFYPTAIQQLNDFESWVKDWRRTYQEYRNQHPDSEGRGFSQWQSNMREDLLSLKSILSIEAILQILNENSISRVILVPHRDLHLLPLHSLFPDNLITAYLPSLAMGTSIQVDSCKQTGDFLIIGNPRSDLNFAELEVNILKNLVRGVKATSPDPPQKNVVVPSLNSQPAYFHFAGHGHHNSIYPQKSYLELFGKDCLYLSDIFRLNFNRCSLVSLSACETGVTSDKSTTDEYIGLTSGFLAMGAQCILSTLWPIDSEASALFMIEFYKNLHIHNEVPAVALAKARKWLKTLTINELRKWYVDTLSLLPSSDLRVRPFLETELDRLSILAYNEAGNTMPYDHPYYWAPFIVVGPLR
jgi:CHAT domain-containing protein